MSTPPTSVRRESGSTTTSTTHISASCGLPSGSELNSTDSLPSANPNASIQIQLAASQASSVRREENDSNGGVSTSFRSQTANTNAEVVEPPEPDDGTKLHDDHSKRLQNAISKIVTKTRQDSVFMRYWDCLVLCATGLSFLRFTLGAVVTHLWFAQVQASGILGLILSAVFLGDCFIRFRYLHPRDRLQYSLFFLGFNFVTAFPWDVLTLGLNLPKKDAVGVYAIQASRIFIIPFLFQSTSPDIVNVHYIRFYYIFLPKFQILFTTVLLLHGLTVLHILCIGGDEEQYRTSLLWVWTLITSAPLNISTVNVYDSILAVCLMIFSMLVQGYFVSTVSTILLGFSVQESNRSHMLITLEMLRYYNIPDTLQEEVLSFQYHLLQDSSVQTQFAPELESLPKAMLKEINLCVKIEALNKVTFFDDAPAECKRKLAQVMVQTQVDPLINIVTAGDVGNSMFFMLHGLADVILVNGLVVATIRRGDFFGEMVLLHSGTRRTATVCTITFCDVLELTKKDFDEAILNFPFFKQSIEAKKAKSAPPPTAQVPSLPEVKNEDGGGNVVVMPPPASPEKIVELYDVMSKSGDMSAPIGVLIPGRRSTLGARSARIKIEEPSVLVSQSSGGQSGPSAPFTPLDTPGRRSIFFNPLQPPSDAVSLNASWNSGGGGGGVLGPRHVCEVEVQTDIVGEDGLMELETEHCMGNRDDAVDEGHYGSSALSVDTVKDQLTLLKEEMLSEIRKAYDTAKGNV
eukprot:PhF_6_TR11692/c0_g1_i1/m.18978